MSLEVMLAIAVAVPSWTTALVIFAVAIDGAFVIKSLAASLKALLAKAKYLNGARESRQSGPGIQT